MTLNQIAALATDATFQGQVRAYALSYAFVALAAAPSGPAGVTAARYQLAQQVIQDGCVAMLARLAWGVAATPGFTGVPSDSGDTNDGAIETALINQWNSLALVTGAVAAGD